MKKILVLGFVALGATAFAASNNFKVNIVQNSVVDGKALKAGEYKISVENGNAVLRQGKETIEVPAREETLPQKTQSTELTYMNQTNLRAIDVGGTRTRIVFNTTNSANPGM